MGSLFKQIYRYTRPHAYRHDENPWPFTRITRAPNGEISVLRYKGKMVPLVSLSALKNSIQGEILLTATGSSTHNIDFSLSSKTIPVMDANGAWHLADRLHFSLYIIVDMELFDKKPDIIRAIVSQPKILLFTTMHGTAKILDRYGGALHCRLTLIEDGCCRIYQPKVASEAIEHTYQQNAAMCFHPQCPDIYFNTDIRRGIFDVNTVVYQALQILARLGLNIILVSGLNMTSFSQPRFYGTQQERLPSYLATKANTLTMPSFAYAAQVLQQRQIRVINFSPEGAVPNTIFKKVAFNECFKSE